jgi:hypothetical protein
MALFHLRSQCSHGGREPQNLPAAHRVMQRLESERFPWQIVFPYLMGPT